MRLRIVSYNIHKGVGADRAYSLERIADVIGGYGPDVVALQEVLRFNPSLCRDAQEDVLAEALGMPYRATGWNVPRRQGVYGNVTLSRIPLLGAENIDLKLRFKKRRSALYTALGTAVGSVHLFNVHLGLAHFERVLQMRRLVEESTARAGPAAPVVILGDTNDWGDRLYPRVLERSGFTRCEGLPRRRRATFPSWCPVGSLDKAFVRGDLRMVETFPSRTLTARRASDHLPVVVDLEV